jgi:hypothetical protein
VFLLLFERLYTKEEKASSAASKDLLLFSSSSFFFFYSFSPILRGFYALFFALLLFTNNRE